MGLPGTCSTTRGLLSGGYGPSPCANALPSSDAAVIATAIVKNAAAQLHRIGSRHHERATWSESISSVASNFIAQIDFAVLRGPFQPRHAGYHTPKRTAIDCQTQEVPRGPVRWASDMCESARRQADPNQW